MCSPILTILCAYIVRYTNCIMYILYLERMKKIYYLNLNFLYLRLCCSVGGEPSFSVSLVEVLSLFLISSLHKGCIKLPRFFIQPSLGVSRKTVSVLWDLLGEETPSELLCIWLWCCIFVHTSWLDAKNRPFPMFWGWETFAVLVSSDVWLLPGEFWNSNVNDVKQKCACSHECRWPNDLKILP